MAEPTPLLAKSAIVLDKFWVAGKLGEGTFSEIYTVVNTDNDTLAALKIERKTAMSTLAQEARLLQALQKYPFVPRLYASTNKLRVPGGSSCPGIVMQILGPNVTQVRKAQPEARFRASTACHIGLQMLSALEAVHREGFVHRDVKPSNFVVGYEAAVGGAPGAAPHAADSFRPSQSLFVLDYGLCRQYASRDTAAHKPSSGRTAEFRGTSMYASLNSHSGKELTRRDDLWSLMYVVADLVLGGAPWRKASRVRLECERQKRFFFKTPQRLFAPLAADIARPLLAWHEHLKALKAESTPDYALIAQCLSAAADAAARLEAASLPTRPLAAAQAAASTTDAACDASSADEVANKTATALAAAAPVFPAALKAGAALPAAQAATDSAPQDASSADPTAPSTPSAVQSTFDSASGAPAAPVLSAEAAAPAVPPPTVHELPAGYFDLRRCRFAADEVLCSRGGQWQPRAWRFRRADGGRPAADAAAGMCEAAPPAVEQHGWGCTGMQLGVVDSTGCPLALQQLHAAGDGSALAANTGGTLAGALPAALRRYGRAAAALLSLHAGKGVTVDDTSGLVHAPALPAVAAGAGVPSDLPEQGPLPSYIAPPAPSGPTTGGKAASAQLQDVAAPMVPQQTAEEALHATVCRVAQEALQRLQGASADNEQPAPASPEALYVAAVDAVMAAHRNALTLPSVPPAALAAFRALAAHAPAAERYKQWVQAALSSTSGTDTPSPLEIGALLRFREMQAALRVLGGKPVDTAAGESTNAALGGAQAGSFGAVGQDASPDASGASAAASVDEEDADVTLGDVDGGGDISDSDGSEGGGSEGGEQHATEATTTAQLEDAVSKAEASRARREALLRAARHLLTRVMYSGQPVEPGTVPYAHAAGSACLWLDSAPALLKVRMLLRQLHLQSTPAAPDALAAEAAAAVTHSPTAQPPPTAAVPPLTGKRLHSLPPPGAKDPPHGSTMALQAAGDRPAARGAGGSIPPPPSTPPPSTPPVIPAAAHGAVPSWAVRGAGGGRTGGAAQMPRGPGPTASGGLDNTRSSGKHASHDTESRSHYGHGSYHDNEQPRGSSYAGGMERTPQRTSQQGPSHRDEPRQRRGYHGQHHRSEGSSARFNADGQSAYSGRQDGYDGGRRAGYEGGRRDGYDGGRRAGYEGGRRDGYDGGRRAGYEGGRRDGYDGGRRAGYEGGRRDGYDGGRRAGYEGKQQFGVQQNRFTAGATSEQRYQPGQGSAAQQPRR